MAMTQSTNGSNLGEGMKRPTTSPKTAFALVLLFAAFWSTNAASEVTLVLKRNELTGKQTS
jgi:hypothetical protein